MEFIDVANLVKLPAFSTQNLVQSISKIFSKEFLHITPDGRVTTQVQNMLERRIETCNFTFEVDRQETNIDRLNDRLVEFFQEFEFRRSGLLVLVKQAVFDCDRDISGHGSQYLDVFG